MKASALSLFVLVLTPFLALAQQGPADLNTITRVEVRGSSVVITGTKKPNFTTFTMTDPARLVIDISEAVFSGVPEELPVSGGTVTGIRTASYGSEATAIARVLIGFSREVESDFVAEGNTLVVKVLGDSGAAVAQAPAVQEPAQAAPAQQAPAQQPATAQQQQQRPAAAPADAGTPADATAAARRETENQQRAAADAAAAAKADREAQERAAAQAAAAAKADREAQERAAAEAQARTEQERQATQKAEQQKLAEAQKQADAQKQAEQQKLAEAQKQQQAEAARAAKQAEAEQRKLAQAAEAEAKQQAAAERKAQEEATRRAEAERKAQAQAEASEQKRAAAEAKKQAQAEARAARAAEAQARREAAEADSGEAEAPRSGGSRRNTMTFVGFKQEASTSRVFVRTSAPVRYTVSEGAEGTLILELENTRIGLNNNTRALDTSFFDTAVAAVDPSSGPSRTVRIAIRLKSQVPYQARQDGNEVSLEFPRPTRR